MATRQRGRPRAFDRDAALDSATRLFWERGYEATSVADLTRAMGIGTPSLYAAFGDKRALFREAVAGYAGRYGDFTRRAMEEEPTARAAAARLLREAAAEYTEPGRPRGCLVITAATNCSPASAEVEEELRAIRNGNVEAFERKIQHDVDEGVLPADADARVLARLLGAVLQGLSQQARDGASRADLEAVADTVMRAWPAETR
ncbi:MULTISPECIES: TetR/AcrR family transcriptional regulator [Actinomadura]|uniref:TetR/AcrR family transcriptional regulator n=1 Tax=Actinomadura yumaensis TaxID=111807 RepID=A0ABW2CBR2_9ACTN|nr:TetR/AcrR family transcriptional regulator [Actinomadura sp. J1-007]MWK33826.1 TetR family transcriptional regulator [Actinomadura sp. J1-007]